MALAESFRSHGIVTASATERTLSPIPAKVTPFKTHYRELCSDGQTVMQLEVIKTGNFFGFQSPSDTTRYVPEGTIISLIRDDRVVKRFTVPHLPEGFTELPPEEVQKALEISNARNGLERKIYWYHESPRPLHRAIRALRRLASPANL
jgi:hypothetical protein